MKLVISSFLFYLVKSQTPGWYHSDLDQSCNEKCADVGIAFQSERTSLICTATNFGVVVNNLRNSGTFGGCGSGYEDDVVQGGAPWKDETTGKCVFRSQGQQNGDQKDANAKRMCCCSASAAGSLLDCPLQEISSCSQCSLAALFPATWGAVCQNSVCQTGQTFVNGECVCDAHD